jgi:hypothetical protein
LIRHRRWALLAVYLPLLAVSFTLSLGPPGGGAPGSWSPFSALAVVPGLGAFRAPARFGLLVLLAVSVLAASGAELILRISRFARVVLVAAVPLMLSEWYVIGFPGGKPDAFPIPEIYRVDALATANAIVSLPDYRGTREWYLEPDYMYFSTAHWKRIVNGYGRSEPPQHPHVISHMNAFPGPNNARTMRTLGVTYVVLHTGRYDDGAAEIVRAARESPEYELVAQVGADYLFRVRP